MIVFVLLIFILSVININESLFVCPSHEKLVCFQMVCGQTASCECQCVEDYYRDLNTNKCVLGVCGIRFRGVGPILRCTSNETIICRERTCLVSDAFRCSCQCKNGLYNDPSSKSCVKECPK